MLCGILGILHGGSVSEDNLNSLHEDQYSVAKHILITGVAGFIGSTQAMKLLQRGDTVYGIDNMNDYYDVNLKQARLDRFVDHERFTFQKLDIIDREDMTQLFNENRFDAAMHLAAQAGVR